MSSGDVMNVNDNDDAVQQLNNDNNHTNLLPHSPSKSIESPSNIDTNSSNSPPKNLAEDLIKTLGDNTVAEMTSRNLQNPSRNPTLLKMNPENDLPNIANPLLEHMLLKRIMSVKMANATRYT